MMGPNSPTLGNAEMKSIEMLAQGEGAEKAGNSAPSPWASRT